jgi:exopolyphosphatase/guanosine-5'-triphosphate,3'-diphosphate pyrophosphatase
MDIGGGSTEFLLADGAEVRATVSTGLGVVKLTEAHLKADPPLPGDLAAVRDVVASRVARVRTRDLPDLVSAAPDSGLAFVGTAGTVTSLAAIDLALDPYDPERVNGHRLTRDRVAALCGELASSTDRPRGLRPIRRWSRVAGRPEPEDNESGVTSGRPPKAVEGR